MKPIYDKARNRLLATVIVFAALPLILVLIIRAVEELEPIFAAVGFIVIARFGWQWYRGGGW